MAGGYKADSTPLLKALLHAAKYPAYSVNGVLLGYSGTAAGDHDGVHIVDAVPLFHTPLSLAPTLEVALAMVRRLELWPTWGPRVRRVASRSDSSSCREVVAPCARAVGSVF